MRRWTGRAQTQAPPQFFQWCVAKVTDHPTSLGEKLTAGKCKTLIAAEIENYLDWSLLVENIEKWKILIL